MNHLKLLCLMVAVLLLSSAENTVTSGLTKCEYSTYLLEAEVVDKPAGTGTVVMRLGGAPDAECKNTCTEHEFWLEPKDGLTVDEPMRWTGTAHPDNPSLRDFTIHVPEGDTCAFYWLAKSECGGGGGVLFFISASDTIEVHHGKIRRADRRTGNAKYADWLQEILGEKQMDYEYDIWVSLHLYRGEIPSWIDSLLGPLTPDEEEYAYTTRTTKRRILDLARTNVAFKIRTPEYPDVRATIDSAIAADSAFTEPSKPPNDSVGGLRIRKVPQKKQSSTWGDYAITVDQGRPQHARSRCTS